MTCHPRLVTLTVTSSGALLSGFVRVQAVEPWVWCPGRLRRSQSRTPQAVEQRSSGGSRKGNPGILDGEDYRRMEAFDARDGVS